MAKCPLVSIDIGDARCPNKTCMWHSKVIEVKNSCVAIHEPQYEHLSVEELGALKGIHKIAAYTTKTKRNVLLIVLFAEYVEYIRDNFSSCLAKVGKKKKHRSILKIEELSISKRMLSRIVNNINYRKFCKIRKPVLDISLNELLSTLGEF